MVLHPHALRGVPLLVLHPPRVLLSPEVHLGPEEVREAKARGESADCEPRRECELQPQLYRGPAQGRWQPGGVNLV